VVKKSLADTEDSDCRSLTDSQFHGLIEYYNTCSIPRRKEFLEMFLFSYHACGLRLVDVMTLQWGHINFEKKELRKVLVKTNKRHEIPLSDSAIKILERWREKRGMCRYVFDLVREDLDLNDEEALYRARNNATKCINQSLLVVGEQLAFPFPLTMHVARHTFAVHALNNGMSMSVVSRLLGHANTEVTEQVYAHYLPDTLMSEVEKLKDKLDAFSL
jgi:integrase